MGVIELFVYIVVVVLLGWAATWIIDYLAPGHPALIDRLIWFVVIVLVVFILVQAFGLLRFDPQVPRLGGK